MPAIRDAVRGLTAEDFDAVAKLFDRDMAAALDARGLESGWRSITASMGPLERVGITKVDADGDSVSGDTMLFFKSGKLRMLTRMNAKGELSSLVLRPAGDVSWLPPGYVKPGSFNTEEVSVAPERGPLPARLSIPRGAIGLPSVVIVHGSGPGDADGTIGGMKPYLDLAWGLASRGIAVLRYEKRTLVYPGEILAKKSMTVQDETIDDAVSGIDLLASRRELDSDRVFVLGHSLGAMVAPRIAQQEPRARGLVMLAAPTRGMPEMALEQFDHIIRLGGPNVDHVRKQREALAEQIATLATATRRTPASKLPFGVPLSYWNDLREYDPVATAAAIDRPMFIAQGERDYQVTMVDFEAWKRGLGGRRDVTFKTYKKCNHVFAEGKGPSRPEEYEKPDHVTKAVVNDIADWIKKH